MSTADAAELTRPLSDRVVTTRPVPRTGDRQIPDRHAVVSKTLALVSVMESATSSAFQQRRLTPLDRRAWIGIYAGGASSQGVAVSVKRNAAAFEAALRSSGVRVQPSEQSRDS